MTRLSVYWYRAMVTWKQTRKIENLIKVIQELVDKKGKFISKKSSNSREP